MPARVRKACTRILIRKEWWILITWKGNLSNLIWNSHDLRCLSLHGRINDIYEGAASPADGGDQQEVQRLLGGQQIGPVPLPDSLDKYADLSLSQILSKISICLISRWIHSEIFLFQTWHQMSSPYLCFCNVALWNGSFVIVPDERTNCCEY